jgi:hypothetical protein
LGDGEIGRENYAGPGAGTLGGRRVGEGLGIVVVEFVTFKERDDARCGVRMGHGRIGEGGIAGADLELSGGDGGEQHEQGYERGGEFRTLGSGHWSLQMADARSRKVRCGPHGEKPRW